MKRILQVVSTITVLVVLGCAPTTNFPKIDDKTAAQEARKQRMLFLESMFKDNARLYAVSWAIQKNNVELCGATKYAFGFLPYHSSAFPSEYHNLLRNFGVDERITMVEIANGSPFQRSGVKRGDILASVNGKEIGKGKRAMRRLGRVLNTKSGEPVTFGIVRGSSTETMVVRPTEVCAYPVSIFRSDAVNALADGKAVYISSGMLDFVENDEELALVVGHEMAHNTRNHMRSKRANQMIGALIGALAGTAIYGTGPYGTTTPGAQQMTNLGAEAGAAAFSQEFESEADYVGVYHAARAGFDVSNAATMWRRMGAKNPRSISLLGTTHPSTAKRYLAIEKAVQEIELKRQAGLPLVPEE